MDTFYRLLLQLVLILLNAFFAATEIAILSLNEKKVKACADDGKTRVHVAGGEVECRVAAAFSCWMCLGVRLDDKT